MKISITVTESELGEMELSETSLEELFYNSQMSEDLVGFEVCVSTVKGG